MDLKITNRMCLYTVEHMCKCMSECVQMSKEEQGRECAPVAAFFIYIWQGYCCSYNIVLKLYLKRGFY